MRSIHTFFTCLLSGATALIAPPACPVCVRPVTAAGLCNDCRHLLKPAAPVGCPVCARPGPVTAPCGQCVMVPPAFSSTSAAFAWNSPLRELVHGFKYDGRLDIGAGLAAELTRHIAAAPRPDCLIAVPLSAERLRNRGFNQAHELAAPAARRLKLPAHTSGVIRIRHTRPQTGLKAGARLLNMRDAFCISRNLSQQQVVLIDDVMTTGATVDALARACRAAGASDVRVHVLARAVPPAIGRGLARPVERPSARVPECPTKRQSTARY